MTPKENRSINVNNNIKRSPMNWKDRETRMEPVFRGEPVSIIKLIIKIILNSLLKFYNFMKFMSQLFYIFLIFIIFLLLLLW